MSFVTGYQGYFNPNQTVTIANGQQSSSAFATGGMCLVGIILPAAFTGTSLTFEVSSSINGTYQPLYDSSDNPVIMTVTQGRVYGVDPAYFQGVQFLKIKSGSAEGGARTIVCSLKGF